MRRSLPILLLPIILAAGKREPKRDLILLKAIEQVESGGREDAVGDGGKAVGCLQIHPITVRDANRILGRREFTLKDRLKRSRSYAIFWTIMDHYSKGASRETMARRWNGGPRGEKKKATRSYWLKVKAMIRKLAKESSQKK